jgi:hypothetical protein
VKKLRIIQAVWRCIRNKRGHFHLAFYTRSPRHEVKHQYANKKWKLYRLARMRCDVVLQWTSRYMQNFTFRLCLLPHICTCWHDMWS